MQAHVLRAACRSMAGGASKDPTCRHAVSGGDCAPGSEFDLACRSRAHKHANRCVYKSAKAEEEAEKNPRASADYHACKCSPGWRNPDASVESNEDDEECEDINECTDTPQAQLLSATDGDGDVAETPQHPCYGMGQNEQRTLCFNTPGSFSCLVDQPDLCTEEENFNSCFKQTLEDGEEVSACRDNIDNVRSGQ